MKWILATEKTIAMLYFARAGRGKMSVLFARVPLERYLLFKKQTFESWHYARPV